jgi:hypothetical protein
VPCYLHACAFASLEWRATQQVSAPPSRIAARRHTSLLLAYAPADRNRGRLAFKFQFAPRNLSPAQLTVGLGLRQAVAYNDSFDHALRRATNSLALYLVAVEGEQSLWIKRLCGVHLWRSSRLGGHILQFCRAWLGPPSTTAPRRWRALLQIYIGPHFC